MSNDNVKEASSPLVDGISKQDSQPDTKKNYSKTTRVEGSRNGNFTLTKGLITND